MFDSNEIAFRLVKMINIAIVGNYFFFSGVIMSILINAIMPSFDEKDKKKKKTIVLFGEIVLNIALIMIIAYILRNVIELIPSPLEGVAGYEQSRLKELSGGVVLAFSILVLQPNLKNRLLELVSRFKKN